MKKTLSLIIMLIAVYVSNAQENNPYNKVGLDFASSLKIIKEDFKAGKVKDFSNESIDAYTQQLPLKVKADMDIAGSVYNTLKSKDFNFVSFVKESKLSETSKELFITVAINPDKLDNKALKAYLTKKTAEISKSKLDESEKEMVLSMIATVYNSDELSRANNIFNSNCTYIDPQGNVHPIDCATAGTIIGGIIGWSICGPLCGLGGAIIGNLVGSVS